MSVQAVNSGRLSLAGYAKLLKVVVRGGATWRSVSKKTGAYMVDLWKQKDATEATGTAAELTAPKIAGLGDASVHLYQPITVGTSGQRVAILGPGRDVMPYTTAQAVINGVTVTNGAQVTLMNLAVTNHQSQPAVRCSGSSTLYMNNVLISDSAQPPQGGIYATLCSKVTIEKTKVSYAGGHGVYIVGGSGHRVINNAIINSGSAAEPAGMRP